MQSENEKLSIFKRVGGFLLIILVLIGFFLLGGKLIGLFTSHEPVPDIFRVTGHLVNVLLAAAFGALAAAAVVYVTVLLTNCFTFDFNIPFFSKFKKKLYLISIAVFLGLSLSMGFFVSVPVTPILVRLGIPGPLPFIIPILISLIVVQLILIWVNIWAPLDRMILSKRMTLLGIDPASLGKGTLVGISDPARSSFKKLTLVEDDVGVLWIEPAQLVYRGDTENFVLKRDNIISVECKADAGSMASYAGAVFPILHYRNTDGNESTIRLHAWGCWSLSGLSKSLRLLSSKLESWHSSGTDLSTEKDRNIIHEE
ncbi:MAG: hypothetical protein K8S24_03900 [Candidatus Aegiribacteria sp.]|nr:hypothetical protein [Candidatus Aegiribacteria sp.]